MPKNLIQHLEWSTRDAKRLQKFYGRVFDWTFSKGPGDGYVMIDGIGGIFPVTDPHMPIGITQYVNVENLETSERAIVKAGGELVRSNQPVPGMGRFSIFADPDGNLVAIWEAQMKATPQAAQPKRKAASKPAPKRKAKPSPAKKK